MVDTEASADGVGVHILPPQAEQLAGIYPRWPLVAGLDDAGGGSDNLILVRPFISKASSVEAP